MMRLLKVFTIIIVIIAAGLFAVSEILQYLNTDHTLPEITAESETLEIPCEYTQEQLLEGVRASDEKDGNLTDQIIVGSFSRFIEPGVCDLTYTVFDSSNHMATLTRRVEFSDYNSPRFSLSGPLVFEEGITNLKNVRAMFSATDILDGDLSGWVTYVNSDADFNKAGTYSITMEVRNSLGDTVSYDFPIHIYRSETQSVSIRLTNALVYVKKGDRFRAADYVDTVIDTFGEEFDASDLNITSNVDVNTPGLYEVHYEFQSSETSSVQSGENWLTVIVEEE